MSWPALSDSERFVDWSYYQNQGGLTHKPFSVPDFCAAHPEVAGAILRFNWPDLSPDQLYASYFDGWMQEQKKVMAYGWIDPRLSMDKNMAQWRVALGSRVSKAIFRDWEEVSTFSGLSNSKLSDAFYNSENAVRDAFPDVRHGDYSRGSFLDARIIRRAGFDEIEWWLAHWPYPPPDFSDQAHSFSELDTMLPIDNNFTPFRGNVVKIQVAQVIGWQASSRLTIVPRGYSDGGYFLKSFLAEVFGGTPIPPPGQKVPVEVHVPAGKVDVKVYEI